MYGGGLFLTDIVISGAIDPEQPTATKGGGGIVVWKSRAEAADTADHATLVTERVTFTRITPTAVLNVDDDIQSSLHMNGGLLQVRHPLAKLPSPYPLKAL
ncbi:hypothetical protein OEZ86_013132 [Tetradesmus obliquus]|nr:hypothetical protein OEZ86_013132 [Tetradesmus obliquus]